MVTGMAADVHHGWLRSVTLKIVVVIGLVLVGLISSVLTNSELSAGNYFSSAYMVKRDSNTLEAFPLPDSSVASIFQRLLHDKYPECQLASSLQPIRLSTMGYYENSSNPFPPYDHISCFLMKARYNCAYRPDAPFDMAHKHELVFRFPNRTKSCSLKALIADTLEEWNDFLMDDISKDEKETKKQQQRRRYHVLIQGNSYLRQIFEALVCKVMSMSSLSSTHKQHQQQQPQPMVPITDFSVQLGGPGIAMSDFRARDFRLIRVEELGQPLTNWTLLQTLGCHGESRSDISPYYRRKAIVPPNLAHCNDNIGMIELGHEWRFYYIFQPTMYQGETLETIYRQRFGIANHTSINKAAEEDVFWLLWNWVRKEPQNTTLASIVPIRQLSLESWLWTLRDLQLRDLGEYFGANNPWVSKPPDFHACMPGTPDDQVNLMLFLLWSGYEIDS